MSDLPETNRPGTVPDRTLDRFDPRPEVQMPGGRPGTRSQAGSQRREIPREERR